MDTNNIPRQQDEVNLMEYLIVLLKGKELIIKVTLASMFLAGVGSLFMPPVYLAEAKILPPQSGTSSMASVLASQMSGMGLSASALGVKNTNDLYVALLRARGVCDYAIDKLDLIKGYEVDSREGARKILYDGLVIRDDKKSGIIAVGFQHRNPAKAAEIANAYVEGLQRFSNNLAVTEAGQRRLFFEEQLKNAKENLIQSEENLKYFQQRTGTIKIDDEAKAVIGTVAELRARISAKEVQLRVMQSYATPQNPDLQRLQDETLALKGELRKMESKSRLEDDSVPTVGKMSSLGTEYIRRMREFKYNEALYEILMKQFEAAKLDESKDAALIQVIERAEPPDMRIKPKRRQIVLRAGAFFFFIAIMFVLGKNYFNRYRSVPENRNEWDRIVELLELKSLKDEVFQYLNSIRSMVVRK